jgi:hypothetical protein
MVSLEMVKFFQGIQINKDEDMISRDNINAEVNSSNLNEELG